MAEDFIKNMRAVAVSAVAVSVPILVTLLSTAPAPEPPDAIIVGAGISGLSAALEAARGGAKVTVVDMSTVGGGHAVLSNGAVCIVATPFQEKNQIRDTAELARQDFLERGEDADAGWVSRYVHDSNTWLYDWFTALGVEFDSVVKPPGNSVPRLHLTRGKGLGLVGPLFRECLRHPSITFMWATKAEKILTARGTVRGLLVRNLRTNQVRTLEGRNIVIATGGFGSNLELVRKHWPADLPSPARLLAGASPSATGSGHEMVVNAGGVLTRMDHQWSYVLGLPDPRDSTGARGLASFNFQGIWVNQLGKRFMQEFGDPKALFRTLLSQPGGSYWTVFDSAGKPGFTITLAGYDGFREVSRLVYDSEGVVLQADSIDELARKMNVPIHEFRQTIARYNELADQGVDADFNAFGPKTSPKPRRIEKPPFFAAQFFPITRKSMGGVSVDDACRVVTAAGKPIENLYAVGEVTGFAGINGRAALEGTFLGPGAYMGRLAGRRIATRKNLSSPVELRALPAKVKPADFPNETCTACHSIQIDVRKNRSGYWHFERSHAKVLDQGYRCSRCHSGMTPYHSDTHTLDLLAQTENCAACHGVASERAEFQP